MEICWCCTVAGVLFLAWSYFIVTHLNNIVFNKLNFTANLDPNIEQRFKPFERYDRSRWNMAEMYFCAIFLLPFRFLSIVFSMAFLVLVLKIFVGVKPDSHKIEYPTWQRMLIKGLSQGVARFILFCSGIYWIEKSHANISDYDKEYPLSQNLHKDKAPIIISNHISWLDTMYYASSSIFPSFLSKLEVKKLPLFGDTAQIFQCIFVDRENQEDKSHVRDSLKERAELIREGKHLPPIVIFPEGTTSNGTHILSFKKGGFEPLLPVKIVCLQYPVRNFNVALDMMDQDVNLILILSQFKNNLKVIEFNTFYPDYLNLSQDNEDDWQIYARKIKNIMLAAMPHLKNSENGFRDVKDYLLVLDAQQKEIAESKKNKQE